MHVYLLQSLFVIMMLSSQAVIQIGSLKMGEIKKEGTVRRCAHEVWFIFGAFVSNYSKLAKHRVEVYDANIQ